MLGLGASSNVIVERWNGIPFEKPLTKMRETVEYLRPVLAGERGAGGFKLESPPAEPVPIVLAALRGKMLRLAAEIGDGAFTNFLPLSGLPRVVEGVREGEAAAGKEPGAASSPAASSASRSRRGEALADARSSCSPPTRPSRSTAEFFRWLGWGEQIDPMVEAWQERRPREGARAGAARSSCSDIFIFGSFDEQRARLREFTDGGITTAILTPMCGPDRLDEVIRGLAPGAPSHELPALQHPVSSPARRPASGGARSSASRARGAP